MLITFYVASLYGKDYKYTLFCWKSLTFVDTCHASW